MVEIRRLAGWIVEISGENILENVKKTKKLAFVFFLKIHWLRLQFDG